ncbi:thiosulfate oxidation carrier protein SoxY [Caldichromatium japonicum]|uniref:Thiosulfate oxidation carrier protein SoxY n=2 Tax=Caldichromatium japonicum TaxID=2699430 RepID=A0A6G7VGV0_9GAMM|nr:thiosulfate oxidation carrier protein SoxY [Caldichromatium japonicum]QIK39172.1 thiosulfate oxidation carrier protein SoxY [Caldichromatium japonicum]
MIDRKRRTLILGALTGCSAWLASRLALAGWNADAFHSKDITSALKGLLGMESAETSERIQIKAPDIAENGAVVPITVETDLPDVRSITLVAAKNPNPLVASFEFVDPSVTPFVSTRIKMAETADLIAVVQSGDKFYQNARTVKVTIGGCGG